ncbi:hypothetical protein llap_17911 [Limosa lapponica baueri]|uniref:Uncharacterized protein n=1 Tax=Limosa lapponica baueri TaxID=1758121 RepID=A0A2I0TDC5_LIMLA|nr:hypothetical protein llap_17911 [Limosa lapponica baueri]
MLPVAGSAAGPAARSLSATLAQGHHLPVASLGCGATGAWERVSSGPGGGGKPHSGSPAPWWKPSSGCSPRSSPVVQSPSFPRGEVKEGGDRKQGEKNVEKKKAKKRGKTHLISQRKKKKEEEKEKKGEKKKGGGEEQGKEKRKKKTKKENEEKRKKEEKIEKKIKKEKVKEK